MSLFEVVLTDHNRTEVRLLNMGGHSSLGGSHLDILARDLIVEAFRSLLVDGAGRPIPRMEIPYRPEDARTKVGARHKGTTNSERHADDTGVHGPTPLETNTRLFDRNAERSKVRLCNENGDLICDWPLVAAMSERGESVHPDTLGIGVFAILLLAIIATFAVGNSWQKELKEHITKAGQDVAKLFLQQLAAPRVPADRKQLNDLESGLARMTTVVQEVRDILRSWVPSANDLWAPSQSGAGMQEIPSLCVQTLDAVRHQDQSLVCIHRSRTSESESAGKMDEILRLCERIREETGRWVCVRQWVADVSSDLKKLRQRLPEPNPAGRIERVKEYYEALAQEVAEELTPTAPRSGDDAAMRALSRIRDHLAKLSNACPALDPVTERMKTDIDTCLKTAAGTDGLQEVVKGFAVVDDEDLVLKQILREDATILRDPKRLVAFHSDKAVLSQRRLGATTINRGDRRGKSSPRRSQRPR